MFRAIRFVSLLTLGFVLSVQIGCNSSDTATEPATNQADQHDHELTFGQAVDKIQELAGTIGESMAKDDADAAHHPLHEIGNLLNGLPHLAEHEELSEESLKLLQDAVDKMMDAYSAVDATMHGEEGKSYDDVKGDIDAALETLESFDHPQNDFVDRVRHRDQCWL